MENLIRWCPDPDIPESPCYDFALHSPAMGCLTLILNYAAIAGNARRDLMLTFSEVRAFRMFWDGDGLCEIPNRPLCRGSSHYWPLLAVENSRWLADDDFAGSRAVAEVCREAPWQHFQILTLERHIDIMARGTVASEWVVQAGRS